MHDASDPIFSRLVDTWISNATAGGVHTFDELVESLPGVFPSIAMERLHNTHSGRGSSPLRNSNPPIRPSLIDWPELPIPHPLDFTWWFDRSSADQIVRLALDLTQPNDRLVFLGAPTLYLSGCSRLIDRKLVLLDADRAVVSRLGSPNSDHQAVLCDLLADELPELTAQLVVADPPWYFDELKHFLWATRQLCQRGSTVLFSCPPRGTRPGVEEEIVEVFEWAKQLGLELDSIDRGVLCYLSPPFEQNALRAGGISHVSPTWRHGDLARFTCCSVSRAERPAPIRRSEWWEETLQGVRIRIRPQVELSGDVHLKSLVAGDILSSVSRRENIRNSVEVWTSGNRIFACENRAALREILRAMKEERDPATATATLLNRPLSAEERMSVKETASQIRGVIQEELIECGPMGDQNGDG
jgi:hypothetical protein